MPPWRIVPILKSQLHGGARYDNLPRQQDAPQPSVLSSRGLYRIFMLTQSHRVRIIWKYVQTKHYAVAVAGVTLLLRNKETHTWISQVSICQYDNRAHSDTDDKIRRANYSHFTLLINGVAWLVASGSRLLICIFAFVSPDVWWVRTFTAWQAADILLGMNISANAWINPLGILYLHKQWAVGYKADCRDQSQDKWASLQIKCVSGEQRCCPSRSRSVYPTKSHFNDACFLLWKQFLHKKIFLQRATKKFTEIFTFVQQSCTIKKFIFPIKCIFLFIEMVCWQKTTLNFTVAEVDTTCRFLSGMRNSTWLLR